MTKRDLINALEKYDDDALVVVDVCNEHTTISLTPSSIDISCLAMSIQISQEDTNKIKWLFDQNEYKK